MNRSTMKGLILKLKKCLPLLFWLLIWQLAYSIIRRDIYVPSPFMVFSALKTLIVTLDFWKSVVLSLTRVVLGLGISVIFGVVLGILSGLKPTVYHLLNPLIVAIKSTPVMSFIILALVWFKSGTVPVFICFLMCFPIIWTNVVMGIRQVDSNLLEMARVYRVAERHVIKEIYLPSVMPYFIAGLTMSLGLGWKVSVAAEVLSHPRFAIGSHLHSAKAYLDTPSLFAWTFVVIALSLVFEKILIMGLRKGEDNGN